MAQDTLLGFPAHTLPYRRRKLTTLSTVSRKKTPVGSSYASVSKKSFRPAESVFRTL